MVNMNRGLRLLIKRYRDEFYEENKEFYSEEDYKEAERKFIKFCLTEASGTGYP